MFSLIEDHKKYISNYQNPTFVLYDMTVRATYAIAKVESHICLIATYETKKEEAQTKPFEEFVLELRNWTLFTAATTQ